MASAPRFLLGLLSGTILLATVTVLLLKGGIVTSPRLSRTARATSYISLRGGVRPWEGELVWTPSGRPLCRQTLTQHDADIICASLFPDRPIQHGTLHAASQLSGQQGSQGSRGFLALANLGCTGVESSLDECPRPLAHDIPAVNCPTGAAAIACQAYTPAGDNVRLEGGTATTGRLEMSNGGNWSSICDLSLDTQISRQEALPICKSLGLWYTTPAVSVAGEFGAGSDDLLTTVPQCTGSEPDVSFCSFRPIAAGSICNHTQDAGILCTVPAMPSSAVQLTGFHNQPWRGAVVIREPGSGLTTAVCSHRWTHNNTAVTCKTAGFRYGGTEISPLPNPGGQPKVRLERLECKGHEATLAQCPGYDVINSFQCGSGMTLAAVDCSGNYKVRLVNPDNVHTTGAVEIYLPGTKQWVAFVNGSIDQRAARAVCSSIQYPDTHPEVFASSAAGSNPTLASLDCSSGQDHVAQCVIPKPAVTTGLHAGVRCFGCGTLSRAESGGFVALSSGTVNKDCMYVIRPIGQASLYKLWIDDVILHNGDLLDVREKPEVGPVGLSVGPSSHGPFVLFKHELYVRVKAGSSTGHRAMIHWAPITVETLTSLTCTDDVMKIRVNVTELKWLYNDTNPGYISLVNEGCTGSTIGDIWAIDNPHSQCYTQRQIDGDFVHYRNALIYKEMGAGPIVREHRWRVDLECNFKRQMQVGLNYGLTEVYKYQMNLKSDYSAEIHLYNDSSLHTELKNNQVRAHLGDDLYVNIVLKGQWNVTMHLQDCVARPEPDSLTSYTLIDNGCAVDSQTFIVYTTHNSTLFHFKAFEFYAGFSTVYIFCDVTYCAPFDNSRRCTADCR